MTWPSRTQQIGLALLLALLVLIAIYFLFRHRWPRSAADEELHRRWTKELREFGRPAWVDRVQSWQGDVFTYRWKEGNEPMFYWVYFDPQGIARRAHPGIEFLNAPDERK